VSPPRPFLEKFLGVISGLSLGTSLSNFKSVALTVFELLAFTPIDRPLRTHRQTDRQTDERTHYLRHSLRSLGGDNETLVDNELWLPTYPAPATDGVSGRTIIQSRGIPAISPNFLLQVVLIFGLSCKAVIVIVIAPTISNAP